MSIIITESPIKDLSTGGQTLSDWLDSKRQYSADLLRGEIGIIEAVARGLSPMHPKRYEQICAVINDLNSAIETALGVGE